jgi:putative efflux protein, MATE family
MKNQLNDIDEKKHFYKLVFSLVLPMALQNLINVGVSASDVILLGKLSDTALSASSLAGQIQFILSLIFFGLTSGAAVLTAQYWGKKDIRTIEKLLAVTLRFALVAAFLFTIAALTFPTSLMRIFSSEEDVIAQGVQFLKIIAFTYLISAITMVYLNIMRSVERVVIATVVYSISLVINVFLNVIFIFGLFGITPMGIRGSALGTLIARTVELLIVIIYAHFINKDIKFHFSDLLVRDKLLMKDFLTYSIPVMLNEFVWGAGTSVNAAIIGHLGKTVVAANSVTQVTRQLAMVICFGLANATAIICGKALGENKPEKAKLYASRLIRLTVILGVFGIFVILGASEIAKEFLSLSGKAKSYLGIMMIVMSYFTLCQGYNTTLVVGVFRSGGDTNFGLFLDATTMWCCSILLGAIAAFVLKLPVPVVYIILMSDEILKVPLTTWRYRSMKWVRNVTR